MAYLICQRCGGYYELEEDESPEDFDRCHCGGQLYYAEYLDYEPKRKGRKFYSLISLLIVLVVLVAGYVAFVMPYMEGSGTSPTVLGTDYRGSVSKEIFAASNSTSNTNKKTIAIITGMHPREKLSIKTVSNVIDQYTLSANQEIVHYSVNVTNNPTNYVSGRSSGEELVAKYIIPDIKKSNVDLVIICHDHAPGYGKGYFVATPKMDSPSVAVGDKIDKSLSEFTYYQSTANAEHGTSTLTVSYPLASAGIRTLVYEMPEWASYSQAYQESKKLIATCFNAI